MNAWLIKGFNFLSALKLEKPKAIKSSNYLGSNDSVGFTFSTTISNSNVGIIAIISSFSCEIIILYIASLQLHKQ